VVSEWVKITLSLEILFDINQKLTNFFRLTLGQAGAGLCDGGAL
jgi:hypothetical protein